MRLLVAWTVLLSCFVARQGLAQQVEPALDTRTLNPRYVDAVLERASHMSLGYALGRHGDGFIAGLRLDRPVGRRAALRFFHYTNFGPFHGRFDPVLQVGIDVVFRSPVYFGLFRLYGGGGFYAGFRPDATCRNPVGAADRRRVRAEWSSELSDPQLDRQVEATLLDMQARCEEQKDWFTFSGGGYSGIEFFGGPTRGFFLEVGGGGGAQKNGLWYDAGLILRAGNQFYF